MKFTDILLDEDNKEYKISFSGFYIHFNKKLSPEEEAKVKKLLGSYDFYSAYIDDYSQLKKAEARNEVIRDELKEFGYTKMSKS